MKLPQTTDNIRLVGATKEKIDSHGRDTRSAVIEAANPLAPGESGVVLHLSKGKSASTSLGSGLSIEQTIFYSVWDFSGAETKQPGKPRRPHPRIHNTKLTVQPATRRAGGLASDQTRNSSHCAKNDSIFALHLLASNPCPAQILASPPSPSTYPED